MLTLVEEAGADAAAACHDRSKVDLIAGVSVRSRAAYRESPRSSTLMTQPGESATQDRADRQGRSRSVALVQELVEQVDKETHAPLKSVEILRRARLDGYRGGKSALYELIAELRPHATRLMMRFEGLPGEFSQHDFGEVRIPILRTDSRQVVLFLLVG